MSCLNCKLRGNNADKLEFKNEVERLQDALQMMQLMAFDYDGERDVEGLQKLIDEMAATAVLASEGESIYMDKDPELVKNLSENRDCADCESYAICFGL